MIGNKYSVVSGRWSAKRNIRSPFRPIRQATTCPVGLMATQGPSPGGQARFSSRSNAASSSLIAVARGSPSLPATTSTLTNSPEASNNHGHRGVACRPYAPQRTGPGVGRSLLRRSQHGID